MKGGIAVMLAALKAFETSPDRDRVGYQVVLNSDEEVGSPGSAPLLRRAAAGKLAAFTYEPSALPDGTLAGARPGSGNFSILVKGRSAHAGRNPQDGRNAVIGAADLALRLSALVRPGLTVNCAKIEGGGPNNVVPDHAVLRVNMRPLTPELQTFAEQALDRLMAEVAAAHDLHLHRHGSFARPPKPVDAPGQRLLELVRTCGRLLGQEIGWKDTGGVCDGNNIAACGVPVVDTMGCAAGRSILPRNISLPRALANGRRSARCCCAASRAEGIAHSPPRSGHQSIHHRALLQGQTSGTTPTLKGLQRAMALCRRNPFIPFSHRRIKREGIEHRPPQRVFEHRLGALLRIGLALLIPEIGLEDARRADRQEVLVGQRLQRSIGHAADIDQPLAHQRFQIVGEALEGLSQPLRIWLRGIG
jgi:hypothetical protein